MRWRKSLVHEECWPGVGPRRHVLAGQGRTTWSGAGSNRRPSAFQEQGPPFSRGQAGRLPCSAAAYRLRSTPCTEINETRNETRQVRVVRRPTVHDLAQAAKFRLGRAQGTINRYVALPGQRLRDPATCRPGPPATPSDLRPLSSHDAILSTRSPLMADITASGVSARGHQRSEQELSRLFEYANSFS